MRGMETSLRSLSAGSSMDTRAHAKQVASRYIAGCPASMPGITPMNEKTEMNRNDRGQSISIAHATLRSYSSRSRVSIGSHPPRSRSR